MQGTVLSVGAPNVQGVILGDDGVRYTYTLAGWRTAGVTGAPGMKVDFEIRGSHAVGVYPLPGQAPTYANTATIPQPPPPVVNPGYGNQPPPPVMNPGYGNQPPAGPPPGQPPVITGGYQNQPATPAPSAQAPVVTAAKSDGLKPGKIIAGIACMNLLSWVLFFLPLINQLIGGFVGGRVAGSFKNAALASLVSAVLLWLVVFLLAQAVISLITSPPIIGGIIKSLLGDLLTGGSLVIAFVIVFMNLPMLLMALLGGATAKQQD